MYKIRSKRGKCSKILDAYINLPHDIILSQSAFYSIHKTLISNKFFTKSLEYYRKCLTIEKL